MLNVSSQMQWHSASLVMAAMAAMAAMTTASAASAAECVVHGSTYTVSAVRLPGNDVQVTLGASDEHLSSITIMENRGEVLRLRMSEILANSGPLQPFQVMLPADGVSPAADSIAVFIADRFCAPEPIVDGSAGDLEEAL